MLPYLPIFATPLAGYRDHAGNTFTVSVYGGESVAALMAEGGAWRLLSIEQRLKKLPQLLGGLLVALQNAEEHGVSVQVQCCSS